MNKNYKLIVWYQSELVWVSLSALASFSWIAIKNILFTWPFWLLSGWESVPYQILVLQHRPLPLHVVHQSQFYLHDSKWNRNKTKQNKINHTQWVMYEKEDAFKGDWMEFEYFPFARSSKHIWYLCFVPLCVLTYRVFLVQSIVMPWRSSHSLNCNRSWQNTTLTTLYNKLSANSLGLCRCQFFQWFRLPVSGFCLRHWSSKMQLVYEAICNNSMNVMNDDEKSTEKRRLRIGMSQWFRCQKLF